MPYYEITGKWYHLSYSDYFKHVVNARTPRAAILRFARDLDGFEEEDDIQWDFLPEAVTLGPQEPEPTFWFGSDQMYKVRYIAQVKRQTIECPKCHGKGHVRGFVPIES